MLRLAIVGAAGRMGRMLLESANGAIVGTYLKRDGMVHEPVDETRVLRMRQALDAIAK